MAGSPTILIVDDEPKNIDYLEQELEGFGYSTVSASNGEEALGIVRTNPPSIILLDVMMPVMDGFKTCSILKASDETRFIPVIIMTGQQGIDTIDRVVCDVGQDVAQVPLWVEPGHFGRLDDRIQAAQTPPESEPANK
jgi:CheY-like chemotaxis protein